MVSASARDWLRAFGSAPRASRRRVLSASSAAAISSVVPPGVLLFGSRPAASAAVSSPAVPNSAVRSHDGASRPVLVARAVSGLGGEADKPTPASSEASGSADSSAIVAQQLPAYERNPSLPPDGKPVWKYGGLTAAGETSRLRTCHEPSAAWEVMRKRAPRCHSAAAAGMPLTCKAYSASPVEYASGA